MATEGRRTIVETEGVPRHSAKVATVGWDGRGPYEGCDQVSVNVCSKYAWQIFGLKPQSMIISNDGTWVRLDHITYKGAVQRDGGTPTVMMEVKLVTLLGSNGNAKGSVEDDFLWEAFGERVRSEMRAEGMPMRALAIRVGCPVSSIHRLVNGKGVSVDTLLKVAYVFSLDTVMYLGTWLAYEKGRSR